MDESLREKVFRKMGAEWKWVQTYDPPHNKDGYLKYGWAWVYLGKVLTTPFAKSNCSDQPTDPELILTPEQTLWGIDDLPVLEEQWEVCAKYLVPFMYLRNCDYIFGSRFEWENMDGHTIGSAEIKDDNIAEAACKAFMEVEL